MYKIIEYQSTIGENISLACGKRLGDECANAAVDRQLIRAKILVIYYVPPNFRIHPIQREGERERANIIYTTFIYRVFDWW